MRAIEYHKINPANDKIDIAVGGEIGHGCGANHVYFVSAPPDDKSVGVEPMLTVKFQSGSINEVGINGVTQEVLLAIIIDRLRSFQSGPFSCRENALALTKCEEALQWMHSRTLERMRRGVEGQTKA